MGLTRTQRPNFKAGSWPLRIRRFTVSIETLQRSAICDIVSNGTVLIVGSNVLIFVSVLFVITVQSKDDKHALNRRQRYVPIHSRLQYPPWILLVPEAALLV